MDLIVNGRATRRMLRTLSAVDGYARVTGLEADISLGTGRVTRVLDRVI
jgi:hypothetical protein